jgi:SAM-dependent methyltransferase
MLPDIAGASGLDIGCGEGGNTRALAERGARIVALDIAPTFLRHAHAAEVATPLGIRFVRGDASALPFAADSFDFATAFMSLMDMPDQAAALAEAYRVLRTGGFLQFSILHPCFMPPHRRLLREPDGTVRAIEVGRYFDSIDGRIDRWWFTTLPAAERERVPAFEEPRFHRTLATWVNLLIQTGFAIERIGEPCADEVIARQEPAVADTRTAPLFLHLRVREPCAPPSQVQQINL